MDNDMKKIGISEFGGYEAMVLGLLAIGIFVTKACELGWQGVDVR